MEQQEQTKQQQPPRKVMLGTPTIDGKVHVEYFMSFIASSNALAQHNIILLPQFRAFDTLIQRARNDIIKDAIDAGVDDVVFIDTDMGWTPEQLLRILSHEVDYVAGTARRKNDVESYVCKLKEGEDKVKIGENGLVEVDAVGCGFTRMTKRCFSILWEISERYEDNEGHMNKMVFNLTIQNGVFTSEDASVGFKWRELGEKLYLDPFITCSHTGTKTWTGDFMQWIEVEDLIEKT
jgi:glycosyltransferase involved in cell wall biosynthesis